MAPMKISDVEIKNSFSKFQFSDSEEAATIEVGIR